MRVNFFIFVIKAIIICGCLTCCKGQQDTNQEIARTHNKKGFEYLERYNIYHSFDQSDLDSAKNHFKKAVEYDPNYKEAYFNLVSVYNTEKKFDSSLYTIESYIFNVDSTDVVFLLERVYYTYCVEGISDRLTNRIYECIDAIYLKEQLSETEEVNLSVCYFLLGDKEKALNIIKNSRVIDVFVKEAFFEIIDKEDIENLLPCTLW